MTVTNVNGRARRSLAEQIDRLDGILDGLADALNEAVAGAVQEAVGLAVREAVQAVLAEVLANPQLQQRLRPGPDPAAAVSSIPPALPGRAAVAQVKRLAGGLAGAVKGACGKAAAAVRQVGGQLVGALRRGQGAISALARQGAVLLRGGWLRLVALYALARRLRTPVLVALAVGAATAAGCLLAGPTAASVVSGVNSSALALLGLALRPVERALGRLRGDIAA
jgi:hypothetical protein